MHAARRLCAPRIICDDSTFLRINGQTITDGSSLIEIINPRGSAQVGGVFTLGAVWAPTADIHERGMQIARAGMKKYHEAFKILAKS